MAEAPPRSGDEPGIEHASERAFVWVWVTLALLAVARAAIAFVPTTWLWGLAELRFSPTLIGWALWALSAVVLVPAIARAASVLAHHAVVPDARAGSARWLAAYALWAAVAVVVVVALPERLMLWGNILHREARLDAPASLFATLHPGAFPLDRLLHDRAVQVLGRWRDLGAEDARRILGALEAGVFGALAAHLARAAALEGMAAVAASGGLLWCGVLLLFGGYGEPHGALAVAAAATGVFAIEAVRSGRGLMRMGIAIAAGVQLHPIGLTLLIPGAIVWWRARHHASREGMRAQGMRMAALLVPLVSTALLAPQLLQLASGARAGSWAPPAFGTTHWNADLANGLLMVAPLAVLMAVFVLLPRAVRRPEALVLAALAAPLAVAAFPHLVLGPVRGWDLLVPAGTAMALAVAWLSGESLRSSPRFGWLALPLVLGAAAPTMQALVRQASVGDGLRWVEAFARERPLRSEPERAALWDFIGTREMAAGRVVEAVDAFRKAAALAPSPRLLRQWAASEVRLGHERVAHDIYRKLLERNPNDALAWLEYADLSARLGNFEAARKGAANALTLRPGWAAAAGMLEQLGGPPPVPSDTTR